MLPTPPPFLTPLSSVVAAKAKKDVEEGLVTILAKANGDMGEGDAYAVALRCGACDLMRAAYAWRLVGEEFGGDIEGIRGEFY